MSTIDHHTVSHDDPGAMHYRAKDTAAGLPGPACSPAYVPAGGCGVTDDPYLVTCSICDAREARNIRTRYLLAGQLEAIAAHLPDGPWKVDTGHADYGDRAPHLVRPDGVTLWAHTVTYGPGTGRLEIGAGFPAGYHHSAGDTASLTRPSVTVDPARPADKVGKDIGRRLIPGAVEYWGTVSGRIAARVARQDAAESLARELAGVMGAGEPRERDRTWRGYLPDAVSGSFETYDGQSVTVEFRNLTPDRARELAAVIAGWTA